MFQRQSGGSKPTPYGKELYFSPLRCACLWLPPRGGCRGGDRSRGWRQQPRGSRLGKSAAEKRRGVANATSAGSFRHGSFRHGSAAPPPSRREAYPKTRIDMTVSAFFYPLRRAPRATSLGVRGNLRREQAPALHQDTVPGTLRQRGAELTAPHGEKKSGRFDRSFVFVYLFPKYLSSRPANALP